MTTKIEHFYLQGTVKTERGGRKQKGDDKRPERPQGEQIFLSKVPKQFIRITDDLFNKWCWENYISNYKKINLPHTIPKI